MKYKLSDDCIAHIARALQMAILTGTDIVDNLRLIDLNIEEGSNMLTIDDECKVNFEENIQRLIEKSEELKNS